MMRWNGWGHESTVLPTPEEGLKYLQSKLGAGHPLAEANFDNVLAAVPKSRLENAKVASLSYVDMSSTTRLQHTRGQSLPDWLAMKSGRLNAFPDDVVFPDAVAFPESSEAVRHLLNLAVQEDFNVIPYGGGTSVAGHINPSKGSRPILTLSLARMNRLLDLDEESFIATFGAGTPGPQVEAQLRNKGYTLGHFPQSFEYSTIGGWVASRSSGQQSLKYGRIEQLFMGGHLETLHGSMSIPTIPASAAGPNLKEQVLGSEGRMGVITEVRVKISKVPDQERFYPIFFPSWDKAVAAARHLAQSDIALSMVRVSNEEETRTQLKLAGHPTSIAWLERYLSVRGIKANKCLMFIGITGLHLDVRRTALRVFSELKTFQGVRGPNVMGDKWSQGRFRFPYLRENLWQAGYAVDTLETAIAWPKVQPLVSALEASIRNAGIQRNTQAHVFTHLSHLYPQGSSIYTTYVFPVGASYEETYEHWLAMKSTASEIIVDMGGTISHQHGVGRDHAPYLTKEKGVLGIRAIANQLRLFDPDTRLNPGKLLPQEEDSWV